jgi:dihydroflavonol-4-reductase
MRVLVTGGTGYLGRAVVRALAAAGHDPIVFARGASSAGLPGRAIDGDIRDHAAIDRAAEGCDAICHLAALVSLWRPRAQDFDDVNVGGLRNVIEVVRRRAIPRLIYTSSFLALPPAGRQTPISANDYQRTKVIAEQIAARAATEQVPIVRLYPGVLYGPGPSTEGNLVGRLLRDYVDGRLPGVIGADRQWSYAWIEDVAAAHVRALTDAAAGSAYPLGGDNTPQVRLFEIVRERRGQALPRRIPYALASIAGALEEARARLTGRPPLLTKGTVEIFRHDWPLDSRDATRDLGLRIRPLQEGVERLLAEL